MFLALSRRRRELGALLALLFTPLVAAQNIAIDNATATEGDDGSLAISFPVTISPASAAAITLTVNTANGTATAGADYTAITAGTFNIPAGTTNIDLDVTILNDTIVEADETFTVTISNASSGTIVTSQALGTIVDNDTAVLNLAPVAQPEGNAGNSPMVFTATLSRPVQGTVTADFATSDLVAQVSDGDYLATNGTISFPNGVTSRTISVPISGDTKVENNEAFGLGLTNLTRPPGISAINFGANADVEGTIQNDDTSTLSLANASVTEGNSGTTTLNFVLTSSNASAIPLTVNASTTNASATAPSDFTALVNQLVTIPVGAAGQTLLVPVTVNGDLLVEGNETFTLTLSSPSFGAAVGGPATGAISNDDTTTLSINNVSVNEGNSGTTPATFAVTLSAPVDRAVSFTASTSNGNAIAPADYAALSNQSFSIAAGATSINVPVNVVGELLVEGNETFILTPAAFVAAAPTGNQVPLDPAVLILPANTRGTGTIVNDDSTTLTINNVSVTEGASGTTPATFTVNLSAPVDRAVSFTASTSDGTANAPSDYAPLSNQSFSIAAGGTTTTVTVGVIGDNIVENDETFFVTPAAFVAAPPTGGQTPIDPAALILPANTRGTGTIVNDDFTQISIGDVRRLEGTAPGAVNPFRFPMSMTNPSQLPITVQFTTVNGTATAPSDFTATSGTFTFPPGSQTGEIAVNVNPDDLFEQEETFFVRLSNPAPAQASIARGEGIGTILNDDVVPVPVNDPRALALLILLALGAGLIVLRRS
ncbi:MAG: hypothetical protein MUE46_07140 [Xanthomonadales bacterium]|jgi:hypothetical protein|nr:hypothetical protein [Xanthomonadales bacterium]